MLLEGFEKGGRTLRGQGRNTDELNLSIKRKRKASSEVEDNDDVNENDDGSSDDERMIVKKRRSMKMEASPEVSEHE